MEIPMKKREFEMVGKEKKPGNMRKLGSDSKWVSKRKSKRVRERRSERARER